MVNNTCPSCQYPLKDSDADVRANAICCSNCGERFVLSDYLLGILDQSYKTSLQSIDGIVVNERDNELHLTLKKRVHHTNKHVGYGYFRITSLLPAIAIITYCIYVLFPPQLTSTSPIVHLLLGGLVIGACYQLFRGIAEFFADVSIYVNSQNIEVCYTNLFLFPATNKLILSDKISQLFVKKDIHIVDDETFYSYSLNAQLTDDQDMVIVDGLSEANFAYFLEDKIEKFLGIEDRFLPKEYFPGQEGPYYLKNNNSRKAISPRTNNWIPRDAQCMNCHQSIYHPHINEEYNIIQCPHCKTLDPLYAVQFISKTEAEKFKKDIPKRIARIKISEGQNLKIKISSSIKFGSLLLAIPLSVVLYAWGFPSFTFDQENISASVFINVLSFIVYLLLLLGALFFNWRFISGFVFKQFVEIEERKLRVYKRLFDSYNFHEVLLNSTDINQVYVKEEVKDYRYRLFAQMAAPSTPDILLLKHLRSQAEAQYLEQKIEQYLQIPDQLLKEEYQPPLLTPNYYMNEAYQSFKQSITKMAGRAKR